MIRCSSLLPPYTSPRSLIEPTRAQLSTKRSFSASSERRRACSGRDRDWPDRLPTAGGIVGHTRQLAEFGLGAFPANPLMSEAVNARTHGKQSLN
jgi:hypothetical protein